MPRIRRGPADTTRPLYPDLLSALADELRNDRAIAQPIIDEYTVPSNNAIRVTVIWDRWNQVPDEERSITILQAYELTTHRDFVNHIAFAVGLTAPEAYESGMLPYSIMAAVRSDDPVTIEDCSRAMIDIGASILFDPDRPQLKLPTLELAERCKTELIRLLPGSESVWIIAQDIGRVEELIKS